MADDETEGVAETGGEPAPAGPKGHMIEVAKSGRARCRSCSEGIAKGDLRLGEEAPNVFSDSGGMSYRWHHLKCAATKRPRELKVALARYEGEIPGREELERTIVEWEDRQRSKKKAIAFPYADHATTGRSKCMHCHEAIEKGEIRVAVERPADSYQGAASPGYLHPRCARAHTSRDDLAAALEANTVALSPEELAPVLDAVRA